MSTMNRRELLKFAAAGTVAAGTGALAVQVLTTTGSQAAVEDGTHFDETYRGRRIRGITGGRSACLTSVLPPLQP